MRNAALRQTDRSSVRQERPSQLQILIDQSLRVGETSANLRKVKASLDERNVYAIRQVALRSEPRCGCSVRRVPSRGPPQSFPVASSGNPACKGTPAVMAGTEEKSVDARATRALIKYEDKELDGAAP